MHVTRNSPRNLRLGRVEDWAEARRERKVAAGDPKGAWNAAQLQMAVAGAGDAIAFASITPYRG